MAWFIDAAVRDQASNSLFQFLSLRQWLFIADALMENVAHPEQQRL